MPSDDPLIGASDARPRARLPRPVLLVRNLPLAPHQRRPFRDARWRRPLSTPLRDVAVGAAARDVPRDALSVPVPQSRVSPSHGAAARRPRRFCQTALFQRCAAHAQAKGRPRKRKPKDLEGMTANLGELLSNDFIILMYHLIGIYRLSHVR